jgi:hypothetical protein
MNEEVMAHWGGCFSEKQTNFVQAAICPFIQDGWFNIKLSAD